MTEKDTPKHSVDQEALQRKHETRQENRSPRRMIESRLSALRLARELADQHPDDPAFQGLLQVMREVAAEEGIVADALPPERE